MKSPKENHNIDNESIRSISDSSIEDFFDISNRHSLNLQATIPSNETGLTEKQLKQFYDNTAIDINIPSNNNTSLFTETPESEKSWTSAILKLLTWRNILFVFVSFANALLASILLPQCLGSMSDSESVTLYYAGIISPMFFLIYNKVYQFLITLLSIYTKNNYQVLSVFAYLFIFTLIDLVYLIYLIIGISQEMNQFLQTYAENGIDIFSTDGHPQAREQFYEEIYSPRMCYIALAGLTMAFLALQIIFWLIFIAKNFIFENYKKSGSSLRKKYEIEVSQIHDAVLVILIGSLPPFYICSYLVERNTVNLVGIIIMAFSPFIVAFNIFSKQRKSNPGILCCIFYYLTSFYYLLLVLSKMDAIVYVNDILLQYVLGFLIILSLVIVIPYNIYYLNFDFDERLFYVCTTLFNVIFGILQIVLGTQDTSKFNLQISFYFGFVLVFIASYLKRNTLILALLLLNNLCMVFRFYANNSVSQYWLIPAVSVLSTLAIMVYCKEPEDTTFYISSQGKNSPNRQLYESKQALVPKINSVFTIYKNFIILTFYLVVVFQIQFLAYKSEYFQVVGISLAIGIFFVIVMTALLWSTYWVADTKPMASLLLFLVSNIIMNSYPFYAMYLVIRNYNFYDENLILEAVNWFKITICFAFVIFLFSIINSILSWYVFKNLKTLKKVDSELSQYSV